MNRANNRQQIVLNAIIEDYVTTREPVGSKAVAQRHDLGVSPATIRNDMAQLEEAGLIVQPHTSAGRIPTNAGYRAFVDSIAELKPLSAAERRAIEKILTEAIDLDDVLQRTLRLLTRLTNKAAFVQYPSLPTTVLRHIELVPLTDFLILVVLISDAGRVERRTLECKVSFTEQNLLTINQLINEKLTGLQLRELEVATAQMLGNIPAQYQDFATRLFTVMTQTLEADKIERVAVAGTGNLSRYEVDFTNSISPVLDLLEEQVVLLRLMANQGAGVKVKIGAENANEALAEASVVSTGYGGSDQSMARLGIIGPTRMDYPGAMSSVYAIAKYLNDILGTN